MAPRKGQEPKPWEPQPGEPARWYDRFHSYMMLGPRRTIDKAYQVVTGKRGARAPSHWWKKVKQWNWRNRALELDKLGWDELHQEQEQYARERRSRRIRMIQEIQDQSFVAITNAELDKAEPDEARDLIAALRNLFFDGVRQERIELPVTGNASDNAEPELDHEEDELLRRIYSGDFTDEDLQDFDELEGNAEEDQEEEDG